MGQNRTSCVTADWGFTTTIDGSATGAGCYQRGFLWIFDGGTSCYDLQWTITHCLELDPWDLKDCL